MPAPDRAEGGPEAPEWVQVLTAAGSERDAEAIAAALVERRLAACVQVLGPIVSHYHWQGARRREREWQCLAKTSAARYAQVEAAIRELHPYEEPEIVALPILAGSASYLAWIGECVGPAGAQERNR